MADYKYKRVLLKLSGEALMGEKNFGIDSAMLDKLADELSVPYNDGVEIAIVVGGGNIFRGVSGAADGMDRVQADYMGMLATVMNALALQQAFEHKGMDCRVMTALDMQQIAEPYLRSRAVKHLEKGRITIYAAGTGNPYFTTDTAAALRACEIGAECLMKATKVDGIYDKDPVVHADAVKFDTISYMEVLTRGLKVMDATATALCNDNAMPILVFDIEQENVFTDALQGKHVGTTVVKEEN